MSMALTSITPKEDWTTVFVAVPSSEALPAECEASEFAVDAVRRACRHVGRAAEQAWHIEVTEGRLAPTDDPAKIRRSIRRKLVAEGDAFIALLRDASYGCGREAGWAIRLGIPTLLLHRHGAAPSLHAGGTPPEARVDVRDYDSPAELYDAVCGWMSYRRASILAGPLRRSRQLMVTEPLRHASCAVWDRATRGERRRVCDALLISEEQLTALLANELDFAEARVGLMLDLASQLGLHAPESVAPRSSWYRRGEVAMLPQDAHAGLQSAIDTWGWDGPMTLRAVELGLRKLRRDSELVEAGVQQRTSSLGDRFAWKRLLDDAR
jgi:nucleoside 2-deoxyribosyltransferase